MKNKIFIFGVFLSAFPNLSFAQTVSTAIKKTSDLNASVDFKALTEKLNNEMACHIRQNTKPESVIRFRPVSTLLLSSNLKIKINGNF